MDEKKARRRIVIEETGETRNAQMGEWFIFQFAANDLALHAQIGMWRGAYPIVTVTVEEVPND